MQSNEIRTHPRTMHKNKLKMAERLNIRQDTIKLLEEYIGKTLSDINLTNIFLGQSPKATEIRAKNKLMGLNQTEKLLHSKGNQKENHYLFHLLNAGNQSQPESQPGLF